MTTAGYTYRALPKDGSEIRLLYLTQPPQPGDRIVCSLRHVALQQAPHYAALSYWWGPPVFTDGELNKSTVMLDGVECKINKTLDDALRQYLSLLWSGPITPIWVDALCINQTNNDEKSHQVRLMTRIYSGAQNVFVHINDRVLLNDGAGVTPFARSAMPFLTSVKLKKMILKSQEIPFTTGDLVVPGRCRAMLEAKYGGALPSHMLEEPDLETSAVSFNALLSAPWMSRTWVIQEVVAAKGCRFIFGEPDGNLISLSDMLDAIKCLEWLYTNAEARLLREALPVQFMPPESVRSTETLKFMAIARQAKGQMTLEELVSRFRLAQATDPRDKVYGLMGIARDPDHIPAPDYNASVEAVYVESTAAMIKSSPLALSYLLPEAGLYQQSGQLRLPTWVPEWCNRVTLGIDLAHKYWIGGGMQDGVLRMHEGVASTLKIEHSNDPQAWRLSLTGVVRHVISSIMEDLGKPESPWHFPQMFDAACKPVLAVVASMTPKRQVDAQDTSAEVLLQERFANVVSCNTYITNLPSGQQPLQFGQAAEAYAAYLESAARRIEQGRVGLDMEIELHNHVLRFTSERKLCATSSGLLALVPKCARVDDELVVFENYPTYFVLRPKGEAYTLVGPAFVEDIGAVEASRGSLDGQVVKEIVLV